MVAAGPQLESKAAWSSLQVQAPVASTAGPSPPGSPVAPQGPRNTVQCTLGHGLAKTEGANGSEPARKGLPVSPRVRGCVRRPAGPGWSYLSNSAP